MKNIEEAMKQAKANIEIEGYKIRTEHTQLVRLILERKITEEEFERAVLKLIYGQSGRI